jgi:arsenate reductase-like glutaredoxin family protein
MTQKELKTTIAMTEKHVDEMRNKQGKSYRYLTRAGLSVDFIIQTYDSILIELKSLLK